ncbi:MAG TPA: ABC transporter permease, partial [Kofleriaceae bacterium]|nr:ABC transporter permease [Kofleriaceae bacterium]
MNVLTTLKLALRALWRNKVRSMLTMLGIVFGIGAVIAMVAGGQGAQQSVRDVFQSLGTNVLILTNGSQRSFGAAGGAGSRQSLTWDDMAALQPEISSIKWVAPMLQTRSQVASEEANWNSSVIGTTSVWFQIRNWAAAQGNVFDEDSGNSNAKITVVGKTVATQLFGTANPIGQTIRIAGQPYEIVGVLASKGLAKYVSGQILISMVNDDMAERTMSQITGLLRD